QRPPELRPGAGRNRSLLSATQRKEPPSSPATTTSALLPAVGRFLNSINGALAVAFGLGLTLNYVVVASNENINWDEFALLWRGASTLETGVLNGGGRPGLGTVVTMPFAADCTNPVRSALALRCLWGV